MDQIGADFRLVQGDLHQLVLVILEQKHPVIKKVHPTNNISSSGSNANFKLCDLSASPIRYTTANNSPKRPTFFYQSHRSLSIMGDIISFPNGRTEVAISVMRAGGIPPSSMTDWYCRLYSPVSFPDRSKQCQGRCDEMQVGGVVRREEG